MQRPNSVQSSISVGNFSIRRDDERWYTLQLANQIYGAAFDSRLVRNIREDKGYTYSPRSVFQAMAEGGLYRAVADVRNEVTGATIKEIYAEIEKLRAGGPEAEELSDAKQYSRGVFLLQNATQAGFAGTMNTVNTFGLPRDYPEKFQRQISQPSAEGVKTGAEMLLGSENSVVVIVGDYTKVKDQLAGFTNITFVDLSGKPIPGTEVGRRAGGAARGDCRPSAGRRQFLVSVRRRRGSCAHSSPTLSAGAAELGQLVANPPSREAGLQGAPAHEVADGRSLERQPAERRDEHGDGPVARPAKLEPGRQVRGALVNETGRCRVRDQLVARQQRVDLPAPPELLDDAPGARVGDGASEVVTDHEQAARPDQRAALGEERRRRGPVHERLDGKGQIGRRARPPAAGCSRPRDT